MRDGSETTTIRSTAHEARRSCIRLSLGRFGFSAAQLALVEPLAEATPAGD